MVAARIIALILSGGVLLYYGGKFLVRGGSHIAAILGVSQIVVGLTIVAFGTSLPELVVSLVAALQGSEAIATGNVIGSNIANVGLIVGLSAIVFTVAVPSRLFKRDLHILLGVSLLFSWMAMNGTIERWEGILLFVGILVYTSFSIRAGKGEYPFDDETGSMTQNLAFIIGGILGLSAGARLFVQGATLLAKTLGVSEFVIGATVAAYGTSLPELTTSLVAAYQRKPEISMGNIIGSNLFNILAVLGLVSIVRPLGVEKGILHFELPVMLAYVVALYPLFWARSSIPKIYALILLLGYVVFVSYLFLR